MRWLQRVHVSVRALSLPLKVFAAHETAVHIESADRDGALLVKVKVQHVSPYLAQVRAIFLLHGDRR